MNTHSVNDLGGFHRFLSEKMDNGESALSPEQALDEWRILHPDPGSAEEDRAAIQEAIDDLENGEVGMLFEEFDRDFRVHHNLPAKS